MLLLSDELWIYDSAGARNGLVWYRGRAVQELIASWLESKTMVMAVLTLVLSTALFFFYWQTTIQKILRRAFDQAYYQTIVAASCLEFPALRKAFEEPDATVDFTTLRMNLKFDFLTLTYLLKSAGEKGKSYTFEERLLMVYFRLILASLTVRHWLGLPEKPAVLGLAEVLQYLANLVGERISSFSLDNAPAYESVTNR